MIFNFFKIHFYLNYTINDDFKYKILELNSNKFLIFKKKKKFFQL
jgi:hypothetical protein